MSNKFISIAKFSNALDASIARGLLESNGIGCHTQEERLTPNSPQYKGLNGNTLIQVQRKDILQAVQILKSKGHLRSNEFCVSKWELIFARLFKTQKS